MSFLDIFSKKKEQSSPDEAPAHWIKCPKCQSLMYLKEIQNQHYVCPKCAFHMRISAQDRIELLADKDTITYMDTILAPTDPIKFVDSKSYKKRLSEAKEKTGRNSAIISCECDIEGIGVELLVLDFSFLGGSLASVEGEQIARATSRCISQNRPLIIISSSGGARMQESTFSLMQMAKTSAAIKCLSQHKIPYISVLTDPTMGGVSASFAWLGDFIIAEPGALIGFAGARVIKQTIGRDLPDGFQKSEFLLEHGLIDMIVKRDEMKATIANLLKICTKNQHASIAKEELENSTQATDEIKTEENQDFKLKLKS